MMVQEVFVNYSDYRIVLEQPYFTLSNMLLPICFLIVLTCEEGRDKFIDRSMSQTFRGVAILCVIIGHLATKCIEGRTLFVAGGYLGVTIFLFLSGYGIAIRYGLSKLHRVFWRKRFKRLYIPLWIALLLFLTLDMALIGLKHPLWEIAVNFLGIHLNGALIRIDSPAWYVGFLMHYYLIYYMVSHMRAKQATKLILLFLSDTALFAFIRLSPLHQELRIWLHYMFIFPAGAVVALYQRDFMEKLRSTGSLYLPVVVFVLLSSVCLFVSTEVSAGFRYFRMLLFIPVFMSLALLFQKARVRSRFLVFLGKYSYEIFLLHLPFMVKYDFFLFRGPLLFSFYSYLGFVICLAMALQKLSMFAERNLRFSYAQ